MLYNITVIEYSLEEIPQKDDYRTDYSVIYFRQTKIIHQRIIPGGKVKATCQRNFARLQTSRSFVACSITFGPII